MWSYIQNAVIVLQQDRRHAPRSPKVDVSTRQSAFVSHASIQYSLPPLFDGHVLIEWQWVVDTRYEAFLRFTTTRWSLTSRGVTNLIGPSTRCHASTSPNDGGSSLIRVTGVYLGQVAECAVKSHCMNTRLSGCRACRLLSCCVICSPVVCSPGPMPNDLTISSTRPAIDSKVDSGRPRTDPMGIPWSLSGCSDGLLNVFQPAEIRRLSVERWPRNSGCMTKTVNDMACFSILTVPKYALQPTHRTGCYVRQLPAGCSEPWLKHLRLWHINCVLFWWPSVRRLRYVECAAEHPFIDITGRLSKRPEKIEFLLLLVILPSTLENPGDQMLFEWRRRARIEASNAFSWLVATCYQ